MSEQPLKDKAIFGIIWNGVETFALQGGQFIIGIILARLLTPNDYGLIGMLAIFIAVSQTFVDSGMGHALIQRKDRTDKDYSTVFIFNFLISTSFYLILFITAPLIAGFYDTPQLTLITRVLCLNIVIDSLSLIQNTRLTIELDFKTKAKVSSITILLAGTIGILLAYFGFGVWALIFQTLSRAVFNVIFLYYFSKWKPKLIFDKESFGRLFNFGSKILGASLIGTIFQNVYKVVIGKAYSARELGFYTQAMNIADVTSGSISSIIQKVTFPILASLQDEHERMVSVYKRLIGMTTFFVFPAMVLLSLLAKSFVLFFLTEKWESTIVLLQWLCFARIIRPVSALNMNMLNAIGRSDLFLKVDLTKIPITVVVLIITIPMGVKAIVIGHVITSIIAYFINAYYPGKLFGYGAISQIRDMLKVIVAVCFMAAIVYITSFLFDSHALRFFLGGIIGGIAYLSASFLLKMQESKEVLNLIRVIIPGKKK